MFRFHNQTRVKTSDSDEQVETTQQTILMSASWFINS